MKKPDKPDHSSIDDQHDPSETPSPTDESAPAGPRPTRRALIASIGGLIGAALAKALTRSGEARAASGIPLEADCPNVVFGTTQLDRSQVQVASEPALRVDAGDSTAIRANTPFGAAMVGASGQLSSFAIGTSTLTLATQTGGAFVADGGAGVLGVHSPSDFGSRAVEETAATPAGVLGLAPTRGAGVVGASLIATGALSLASVAADADGTGVLGLQGRAADYLGATSTLRLDGAVVGLSADGTGVRGLQGRAADFNVATGTLSLDGAVVGLSNEGTGVFGATATATGVGVVAANPSGGFALRVSGAAEFSTIGEGLIPEKVLEHDVQDARVGQNSHIVVTFNSPAKKLFVSWVEIVQGFGFRLHLSKKQKVPVSFTYLVLERSS